MDCPIFDSITGLRHWAAVAPERAAFIALNSRIEESGELSYGKLDLRARALAAILQDRVARGDRALLVYPPGLDFIVALFACFYAGVVAVPAPAPHTSQSHRPTRERLSAIAVACEPTLLLTTAALAESLTSIEAALPCLATDGISEAFAAGWTEGRHTAEELAFLQFTSGSTGAPKGVMIRHSNVSANLEVLNRVVKLGPDQRMLTWLPHYHDMGLIGTILYPAAMGSTCWLMAPATFLQRPVRWLQAISRYRIDTSGGPNFAYEYCVRRTTPEERTALDLSCWELAFNGAESVRSGSLDRFAEVFAPHGFRHEAFFPCYGLAESTLMAAAGQRLHGPRQRTADSTAFAHGLLRDAPAGDLGVPLVSSGSPQPKHQIVIADPESGRPLPPGHIGEVWLSGPSVTEGYWGIAEHGAHFATLPVGETIQRFLRTGDLGALWDGELYLAGRLKDLIIVDGRNHHPEDIERTLEQAHSSFRPGACAAFSVELDGAERLIVAIECERKAVRTESVVIAAREAIAVNHELPLRDLVFLRFGELPRTTSGKVRRHACRERYMSGAFNAVAR
ncbi:fatty acyl-AMP ligase [Dyella subtropica]|uniref:fatty acyl-AMP ligase n=1 Tax=Dyella subtropica TaxID=2992127 RepID=UPI0022592C02|nr:fatty acyl-AMP ligase [Dyella subtropica]